MSEKELSVWVQSLGCPKNRVDTERLLGSLGQKVKLVPHVGHANLVFINTCSFIEPATRESIRAVIAAIDKIKTLRRKPLLAVAGCMPSRYEVTELARELPEVNLWLSAADRANWPALINQMLGRNYALNTGRLYKGSSYAWLKISEGCNHRCAFCAIPSIRGPLVSESDDLILQEARLLLEQNARELVVVAQDVTAWGNDFGNSRASLANLLVRLASLPGLAWLRLLYLYPQSLTETLLQTIYQIGAPLLPYFDIPLQHSEPEILARMGRPFREDPRKVLERIHKVYGGKAAIRTTLIVGYPGETDEQFRRLLEFVREARFQNLGVFTYFAEEGTPAATFVNQVEQHVKEERRALIMEVQAEISRQWLAEQVGKRLDVLVDEACPEEWPGLHKGRVWFQAPEIDGITYVSGEGIYPGAMRECDITDSQIYDLSALA